VKCEMNIFNWMGKQFISQIHCIPVLIPICNESYHII